MNKLWLHASPAQRTLRKARVYARVSAALVVGLGAAVLLGWLLDVTVLKSIVPGQVSMKVNTAICLVLLGVGLFVATLADPRRRWKWIVLALSALAGATGAATLAEHTAGLDLGIDQLFWRDDVNAVGTSAPGRMSLNAALAFVLLAIALPAKMAGGRRGRRVSDIMGVSAFAIAFVALIGHLFGVDALTGFASYTRMALHTGLGTLVLSAGVVAALPTGPVAAALASDGPGGSVLRRLLPSYSLVLVGVAGLRLTGQTHHLFGLEMGLAIMVCASIGLFAAATFWTAVALDRTEDRRRASERVLDEQGRRYHTIVDAMFDGVVITENGIITDANRGLAKMFGYAVPELIGRPILELVDGEARTEVAGRHRNREQGVYETLGQTKSGNVIQLEVTARLESYGSRNVRVAALRDISERRSLEAQLRQAQKMEAVGRLAGGVAHDFNNLLTVISGHAQMICDDQAVDAAVRSDVAEILEAARSAAALTSQLLAFSRQQPLTPRVLDLNDVVAHSEALLRRLIGGNITFRLVLGAHAPRITADPAQLEQVMMNLAVNARDAMPDGGALTFETAAVTLDDAYAREHAVEPGTFAMLSVTDSGTGMDTETQRRIFEPFFTTKQLGHGTGLGLATVYGIVRQSGGHIWVYSELGRGTTFKVYLPATDLPVSQQIDVVRPRIAQARNETILLAEDAPAVRALARTVLERHGYNVIEAADGLVAVTLAAAYVGQIHLLVTDVIMPGMGGKHLADRLLDARPSLKVLFISGYTNDALFQQGLLDSDIPMIQKPFALDAFARKVREVLDGASFPDPTNFAFERGA